MTITCPEQFHKAVEFAGEIDNNTEHRLMALIDKSDKSHKLYELLEAVGAARRTLLNCFACRARADAMDNNKPILVTPRTTIIKPDGERVWAYGIPSASLPQRETFIYDDLAPYSFFFRERFIDPISRQIVHIHDKVWYIFEDKTLEEVEKLSIRDMDDILALVRGNHDEAPRAYRTAEEGIAETASAAGHAVRAVELPRVGMCGGIIYHAAYDKDGKRLDHGTWSTHT